MTLGLFLMASSVAATAQSIQTDYDHTANLGRLKTYDFYQQHREQGDPLSSSPMNDRRIHAAIDSQLSAHGFSNSNGRRPDFLIAYFVTTQKGLNIQDNRMGIFQRMGNISVNQITEATMTVVFVDTTLNQEVWRGFVTGKINPKDFDREVNKSIAKLIEKFMKDQSGKR